MVQQSISGRWNCQLGGRIKRIGLIEWMVAGRWLGFVILLLLAVPRAQAQATPTPTDHPPSAAQEEKHDASLTEAAPTLPEHPAEEMNPTKINLFTGAAYTRGEGYRPLTGKERWHLYLDQTFGPSAYFGVAWSSFVDQLGNTPPEWGRGAGGLGLRVASRFGANVVGGTILAAGSALSGEDPRYVSSSGKGFWRRSKHALAFTVLTYNRDGNVRPAYAGLTAQYASSVITQLWLPEHPHVWRDGLRDGTLQLGFNAMFNLVEEFWPELTGIIKHKKHH